MSTSGVWNYSLDWSTLLEQAHMRAGMDIESIGAAQQRFAINMVQAIFADWANNGPNLWAVELATADLAVGDTTFQPASSTVDLLETVVRYQAQDYVLTRFSREDYMELPNKAQTGRPTNFWVDKQIPQYTVYVWPVPNVADYQVRYYRMVQLEDAQGLGTSTFDSPYLWIDALTGALAYRIASREAMKPRALISLDQVNMLKGQYEQSYFSAVRQNSDKSPLRLEPQVGDYYTF